MTGATGFVGRHVLRALQTREHRLRLVARPGTVPGGEWTKDVEVVTTDDLFAESMHWWCDTLRGVDAVLHMAWYTEPGLYLQSPRNLDCLAGTLAMAKACTQAGVGRFVGLGTCFEYDSRPGHLSIDTPLQPESPYAAAKAAAYLALREHFRVAGIAFAWLRLFYLFGEGEDPRRLVPYVRKQLALGNPVELTSGKQVRDYMDVRDAAADIVEQFLGEKQGAVNICSGQGATVRQLVERIADEYGRRDLLKFGARADNFTDPPVVVGIKDRAS